LGAVSTVSDAGVQTWEIYGTGPQRGLVTPRRSGLATVRT